MAIDASEERLSKYELIRPLGSGGMGEVYLARDRVLQRQVAIKFVSSKRLNDPGAGRRLVREARAAAALDHPAICPVYDVVAADDRTCIVMQYVDGETLAVRLSRGPLAPDAAVTLATRIADALAAAHAAGIVHRDLKPQNIVLTADGRPKLLDFGIAQTELPPDVVASIETHTATDAYARAAIVGTPAYMSPEQVLSKPLDGRSDLFSLGALLYECLTGQPAFQAATDVETWARVVYFSPPPPSTGNGALGPAIDAVVAKLLAKDRADRYASAEAAAVALGAVGADTSGAATSRRPWGLVAAAAAAAIVLTGFAAWSVMRPRPLPPAPPEAAKWYEIGTEYLRDGAYSSAERALTEALHVHADYPQALARLAEAQAALDEELAAAASVVHVARIVPDTSRIAGVDGIRLAAVSALVTRDLSRAVAEYERITRLTPDDRGAWLDLARIDHAADRRAEALAASEKALQIDPQYAAGHLRRGMILSELRRGDEALKEFDGAAHLFHVASNIEGETETLYWRARFLNGRGDVTQARAAIDAAARLAQQSDNRLQQVRLALLSSNVIFATGDFDAARRTAAEAIAAARRNQLDAAAAEGGIDLATILMYSRKNDAAAAQLWDSIHLAEHLEAKRVKARATLQLASVYANVGQPRDAIALADGILDFVRRAQYKSMELGVLGLLARSREQLREYSESQRLARQMLTSAESTQDESQIANALESLAGTAAALGSLPEALVFRLREEDIHSRQHQNTLLAFDLANRAELLVRLGRFDEAAAPLDRLDSAIASRLPGFVARGRRVTAIHALLAVERQDFVLAERYGRQVVADSVSSDTKDATYEFGSALLAYAAGRQGRTHVAFSTGSPSMTPDVRREIEYWRALALLAAHRGSDAADLAASALADVAAHPSAEFEWRMAAVAAAAEQQRRAASAATAPARAQAALARLRGAWKAASDTYETRPDLIALKRLAKMS